MIDFFRRLYAFSDGNIEARALPGKNRMFFGLDGDLSIFTEPNKEQHLYFGVATRDGKGGTKQNIVSIPAVWCDIDFKDIPVEMVRENLRNFPFKPSMLVHSGGGIHAYWILNEPGAQQDIPIIEDINKRIAASLGGDFNACDASRVLRIPGTVNHKYPKPCRVLKTEDYLYNLDDFLEILPRHETKPRPADTKSNDEWLTKAMQGCGQGNRNATAAKISGYWINKLPLNDVKEILTLWNSKNTPPLSDNELQKILNSVKRYEPQKEKRRVDISNVYDADRMVEEYQEYLKTLKQNRFITGIGEIDRRIRGVSGGEVLTIIARSGSFKTAMLQNMLLKYRDNSAWGAVFFSIEMPVASVTERYFQILNSATGKDVEAVFTPDTPDVSVDDVIREFRSKMKNLFVVPTKVSLSDLPSYVNLIQTQHNVKIGVIGIDYLGLMDGPGVNEYEVISRLSTGMKNTAKLLNVPIVVLSQVSRKGGSGDTEISLDMGRGSGAIEEGADFVLGMWQIDGEPVEVVGGDPRIPKELVCKILKNRKGPAGSKWLLDLSASTMTIGSEATEYKTKQSSKNSGF